VSVFLDTSALYAVMDRDDTHHPAARRVWTDLLERDVPLWTSNYVLVETFALVQRRLGMAALRLLCDDILPIVRVEWLLPEDHSAAVAAVLTADRRELSLVDATSFQALRRLGQRQVFAFDGHFAQQGFSSVA
jgi:predicted nucleic acid-binding protein